MRMSSPFVLVIKILLSPFLLAVFGLYVRMHKTPLLVYVSSHSSHDVFLDLRETLLNSQNLLALYLFKFKLFSHLLIVTKAVLKSRYNGMLLR